MLVYVPILTTPKTNQLWLIELTEYLKKLDGVEYEIVDGAPSGKELPLRRLEIIENTDPKYTHIWFVDPDDLIEVKMIESALRQIKDSGIDGVILREQGFVDSIENLVGSPKHCCRVIAPINHAKHAGRMIYAKGLSDTAYTKYIRSIGKFRLQTAVGYYWRQHPDQLHKELIQ